jgi:hypothetical protein
MALVFVQFGMNRITTLEPPAASPPAGSCSAGVSLLLSLPFPFPGCDIAHIEAMSVNNMTRVIALYHTINAP